ncbi:unnamed protein product [Fusarium langsethiae]|nr:unnamed protein product [Fusarium langsethiae]
MAVLSTTPPDKSSSLLPPSPPATAERPVKEIDIDIVDGDDSDHPLPDPLQRHKLLSETRDVPEFAHFTLDQKQYRKLYTKIEQTFRRFDYEPKRSRLTIRMPSPTHDYFAAYFRDEICKELNEIASSRSDEAKPFAENVISALGSRVFLAETDDENGPIKREPDIQFHYPRARYPGIVVEVSYSQDGKDLRRLAQDYILYSNGDIKLVIGVDLNYRGKPSTVSLWRPKFTKSEDGLDLETFEHVHEMPFRSSDGDALNPDQSLTIDIHDFATDELSETWPAATINIPFSRLAQHAQHAQQRQKEQEPIRPDDSIKSRRRLIRKRRWSSSSAEELRSEDEAKYSKEEDAVVRKYHASDADYGPPAAKRKG